MRYFKISEDDLQVLSIKEATDDNKFFFYTNSNAVSFSLTDTEYDAFKSEIEALQTYTRQDGFVQKPSGVQTRMADLSFTETETTGFNLDIANNLSFVTFEATKNGADYTYLIYLSQKMLESLNIGDIKMIETVVPETKVKSAIAGNDGSDDYVLFTTIDSSNIKVYLPSGLTAGFKLDLDAEDTAIQTQTSPPDYDIVQTPSQITAKNVRSNAFTSDKINSIVVSRAAGNMSSVIFTGNSIDGYEYVINIILNRDMLLGFNTIVQTL